MSVATAEQDRFEVFFDGDCPLCRREIDMLRRMDRSNRIQFTDITDPSFEPQSLGVGGDRLMERIHGRMPNGELVEGVEVFRQLYTRVGFASAVAFSRLPGVSQMLDWTYAFFAPRRLKWTGRCEAGICGAPPAREQGGM